MTGPPPVGPYLPGSRPPGSPPSGPVADAVVAPRRRRVLIGVLAGIGVLLLVGAVAAAVLIGRGPPSTTSAPDGRPQPVTPAPPARGASVRVPLGVNAFGVAASPDGRFVYAANQRESAITVVDAVTDRVVAVVATTRSPAQVAVSPDGATVWVAGDDGVQGIDTASRAPRISTPVARRPTGLALSLDGARLYVGLDREVVELDTATLAVLRRFPTGSDGKYLAVSPDGRTLAAVSEVDRTVTVVDLATGAVRGRLPLPVPSRPTVTADNRSVIVPTVESTSRNLVVVDLATVTVRTVVPTDGYSVEAVALSPDGGTAYGHGDGARDTGMLFDVDTATWRVRSRTSGPAQNSWLIAVSPDGSRAYVVDTGGRALVVTALR